MQTFNVLYTKQLHKKKKSWNDGRVVVKPTGFATLRDDDGKELSTARISKHIDFAEGEGITCFEGFLVNGDGACDISEAVHATAAVIATAGHEPCPQPSAAPVLAVPHVIQRRSLPALRKKHTISAEQHIADMACPITAPDTDPLSGASCPISGMVLTKSRMLIAFVLADAQILALLGNPTNVGSSTVPQPQNSQVQVLHRRMYSACV